MAAGVHGGAMLYHRAFYSSILSGITVNPALMTIPLDDHMVHRGHGVFDTCLIVDGAAYQLDDHLERLIQSAASARIPLPMSPPRMKRVILDVAAAGRNLNGASVVKLFSIAQSDSHALPDSWAQHADAEFNCLAQVAALRLSLL